VELHSRLVIRLLYFGLLEKTTNDNLLLFRPRCLHHYIELDLGFGLVYLPIGRLGCLRHGWYYGNVSFCFLIIFAAFQIFDGHDLFHQQMLL
jgi:hypothetical protein